MMKRTRFATKTLAVFLTVLLLLSVAPLAAMSDALPKLDLRPRSALPRLGSAQEKKQHYRRAFPV